MVEAALVLPLMIFFSLGVIQLASVEHARLMTEYAAFEAARAGVVSNASNERMRDAAWFSLLPLTGRTDSWTALEKTHLDTKRLDRALARLSLGAPAVALLPGFRVENLLGLVRVDMVEPWADPALAAVWKLPGGSGWEELDFDAADDFPEQRDAEAHFATHYRSHGLDEAAARLRSSTVLAIRLRYFYELRIPFANWVVFTAWYASNAGLFLHGAIDRPSLSATGMWGNSPGIDGLEVKGRGVTHSRGLDSITPEEMVTLWRLGRDGLPGFGRRYFFPLNATHAMRMQSNVYRKWLMHGP